MSPNEISRRSFVALAAAAAASVPLLAACGSSSGGASAGSSSPGGATTSTGAAASGGATSSGSASSAQKMASLYEAAKSEKSLGWYTSALLPAAQSFAANFEAKFPGVKVNIFRGTVPELLQKFSQEQSAGTHNADVFGISSPGASQTYDQQGYLAPYKIADYDLFPASAKGDATLFEVYDKFTPEGCIVFNTQRMKKADVPTSLKDLFTLDPGKYKGKITIFDVTVYPYLNDYMVWLADTDRSTVQKFKDLAPVAQSGSSLVQQKIASGEFWLTPTFNMQGYLDLVKKKAPVDFVIPEEGMWLQPGSHLLAKGAPHPNAAGLFMEYIYSAEGQAAWTSGGYVPTRPGVAPPAGLEYVSTAKIVPVNFVSNFGNQDALTSQAASDLGLKKAS